MTIYGMVASFVWAVLAWYVVTLVAAWLIPYETRMAKALDVERDRMASDERIAEIHARAAVPPLPSPDGPPQTRASIRVPDDLVAFANQWSDEWARDDALDTIRRKYLELHTGNPVETWERVRSAVGVGSLP